MAFSKTLVGGYPKDVTIYTKASIYRLNPDYTQTGIDGNVSLRLDAHEGCTTTPSCANSSGDTVGFTVLSSKDSSLYFSNNWVYDSTTLAWRTVPQAVPGASAIVIQ